MCKGGVAVDGEEKAGREGRVNALEELQVWFSTEMGPLLNLV